MVWLRNLALAGAAFGGSWGGAIWYWRETNRMPATSELALYLLVLPLLLLSGWWLGRKAWARVSAPAAAGTASATPAASITPAATPTPLAPGLRIAASAVRTPHGESVQELRAAMTGNRARPALDIELVDDDGYPILSARLPDASDAALRAALEQWRREQGLDDPRFDTAQWRALAAASAVLSELAAQAASHLHLPAWLQQEQDRQQNRLPPGAAPLPAPAPLQLLASWPADWQMPQRQVAQLWLRDLATQAGWPQQRLAALEMPADGDAAQTLAALLARCGNAQQPCLAIVIAAGSHLSDAGIGRLANDNALFTASQPQGRIPGEGAAGVLLADPAQAELLADASPHASVLQTVVAGQRATCADTAKRDNDACLSTLASEALHGSQIDGASIAGVTADTGHRTSRVTELMHVVTTVAPQLDPGADVTNIGASCGSCGDATWLTALAVADAEVQDRGGPVLCISNEDPYRRCAALLRPALPA
jgi:hypothetical protein